MPVQPDSQAEFVPSGDNYCNPQVAQSIRMRRRQPFSTDKCKEYVMEYETTLQLQTYKSIYPRPPLAPKPENRLALRRPPTRRPARHSYPIFTSPAADSAATRVFNIAELAEHIFLHYEASNYTNYDENQDLNTMSILLKLQLINKTLRGVVMHSPYFSRLVFLKDIPGLRKLWFVQTWNNTINPIISHAPAILRDCFYPFEQISWGMTERTFRLHLRYQYTLELGVSSTSPAQSFHGVRDKIAKHDQGTWRLMKLHHKKDMSVIVTVKVSCRHCGYDGLEEVVLEKGGHQILLENDASLGEVVDRARDMVMWIEAVALEGHDLENAGEDWHCEDRLRLLSLEC